jgi:hypothetical protein
MLVATAFRAHKIAVKAVLRVDVFVTVDNVVTCVGSTSRPG